MNEKIKTLITTVQNGTSCQGLEGKHIATQIISNLFSQENIPFENWFISEIPLVDDSGKYPVSVVICIENATTKQGIGVNLTSNGTMFNCEIGDCDIIECDTIKQTILHPISYYA